MEQQQDWSNTVVFLGSSLCLNDINDSLLNVWDTTEKRYVNLGFPHTCNAIVCEVLEELIVEKKKRPAKVYLALKADTEPDGIHSLYPLIADAGDINESFADQNVLALESILKRMAWNTNYFTQAIKKNNFEADRVMVSEYGIRNPPEADSSEVERIFTKHKRWMTAVFEEMERKNKGQVEPIKSQLMAWKNNWLGNRKFQDDCLRRSIALLEENKIPYDLILYPNLVLQRRGGAEHVKEYYYRKFCQGRTSNPVIIDFGGEYLKEPGYWVDVNHLSSKGADQLTWDFYSGVYSTNCWSNK